MEPKRWQVPKWCAHRAYGSVGTGASPYERAAEQLHHQRVIFDVGHPHTEMRRGGGVLHDVEELEKIGAD